METAKVDIRKLQLLNDRINLCLDALNQVRLSVHGLSHTGALAEGQGIGNPLAQDPRFAPLAQDPRFAGTLSPLAGAPQWTGLAHSTAGYPSSYPAIGAGFFPTFAQQVPGPLGFGGQPGFGPSQLPFAGSMMGLSHTSSDVDAYNRPTWADPFLAAKVANTFPYARYAVAPVVSLF